VRWFEGSILSRVICGVHDKMQNPGEVQMDVHFCSGKKLSRLRAGGLLPQNLSIWAPWRCEGQVLHLRPGWGLACLERHTQCTGKSEIVMHLVLTATKKGNRWPNDQGRWSSLGMAWLMPLRWNLNTATNHCHRSLLGAVAAQLTGTAPGISMTQSHFSAAVIARDGGFNTTAQQHALPDSRSTLTAQKMPAATTDLHPHMSFPHTTSPRTPDRRQCPSALTQQRRSGTRSGDG
jgi:hypothetical protein